MAKITKKGILRNKDEFEIFLLDKSNLKELIKLQKIIQSNLEDKNMLYVFSDSEFKELLGERCVSVGINVDNNLIAFSVILFPGLSEENLGLDLGMRNEELLKVAHHEIAMVHPKYRGNYLSIKMGDYLIEEVRKMKGWRYLCWTIHPYNYPSIKLVLKLGGVILKLKRKYDGHFRYIILKDFLNPIKVDLDDTEFVLSKNLNRQQELLSNNYYGIDLKRTEEGTKLLFAKREI